MPTSDVSLRVLYAKTVEVSLTGREMQDVPASARTDSAGVCCRALAFLAFARHRGLVVGDPKNFIDYFNLSEREAGRSCWFSTFPILNVRVGQRAGRDGEGIGWRYN